MKVVNCRLCSPQLQHNTNLSRSRVRIATFASGYLSLSGELGNLFLLVWCLCGPAQWLAVHPCLERGQSGISGLPR